MMFTEDEFASVEQEPSRRTMLKRAGAAGVAVAWAVPAVQTIGMSDAAAQGSPSPGAAATVTGTVVDSQSGDPIVGALVVVQGTGLSGTTDSTGSYSIANVPAGPQTFEASATGYLNATQNANVPSSGTIVVNFALSAVGGAIRVVLSWGTSPSDLDLHMSGPIAGSASRFHVFYLNRSQGDYVSLDRDDIDGSGPETDTVVVSASDGNTFVEGSYHVWVHNYSGDYANDTEFDASGASITLFGSSGQIGSPFTPPSTGDPTKDIWNVFTFDVDDAGNVSNVVAVQQYLDGDQGTVL